MSTYLNSESRGVIMIFDQICKLIKFYLDSGTLDFIISHANYNNFKYIISPLGKTNNHNLLNQ